MSLVSSLGHFHHDARITLSNDDVTLDFDQMKRAVKSLISYEDEILPLVMRALNVLFQKIRSELNSAKKHELETDANFLNIFFIIFQLPYLSDPGFLFEIATSFYSLVTKLSIDLQAKFVRVLERHKSDLRAYVSHVQQYITMHTVRWCDHTPMSPSNEVLLSHERGMHEGLDVLRVLFYANLLGGKRDKLETIETERVNDQSMEVELAGRRQRRGDEDGDNEDQPNPEQRAAENSVAAAAAASSPLRHRSTSLSMRTSTNESDEIESIYENPLQIKLGLEPNEYRHGYLHFDDFINEFANEKIEINKEYLDFVRSRPGADHFSFIFYPFFLSTINKIGNSSPSSVVLGLTSPSSPAEHRKQSANASTTAQFVLPQYLSGYSGESRVQNLRST